MHVLFLFHAGLKRATIKTHYVSQNESLFWKRQDDTVLAQTNFRLDDCGCCWLAVHCPVSVVSPLSKVGEHFNNRRCTVVITRLQTLTLMGNTGSNIQRTDLIPQFFTLHTLLAQTCKVSGSKVSYSHRLKEKRVLWKWSGTLSNRCGPGIKQSR